VFYSEAMERNPPEPRRSFSSNTLTCLHPQSSSNTAPTNWVVITMRNPSMVDRGPGAGGVEECRIRTEMRRQ
jgi:hypothetical protein